MDFLENATRAVEMPTYTSPACELDGTMTIYNPTFPLFHGPPSYAFSCHPTPPPPPSPSPRPLKRFDMPLSTSDGLFSFVGVNPPASCRHSIYPPITSSLHYPISHHSAITLLYHSSLYYITPQLYCP